MCGKMAEELLSLKWNNHQAHFVDILTFLREQEIFVDATLACGGKLYAAHKFVLSTCSDYFKQMFTKNPSKHPIVFMKDVTSRDLEALLDFMYNGEVNVPQSSLGSLIKTAEGLQIKGLAVPDDPPAPKRDREREKRESRVQLDHHSPPAKRPRPRERSPPQSSPSQPQVTQPASSHPPSATQLSRSRSPQPPTSSGSSQVGMPPVEATLDEDSRTSIQSGLSGLSEQNTSTTPSLSAKPGGGNCQQQQQQQANAGDSAAAQADALAHAQGGEEPSPGPSGLHKHAQSKEEPEFEIKQEDVVDLGEDDEGDWGVEGDGGGGESSMGTENPPNFPEVMLPQSDGTMPATGDPAMEVSPLEQLLLRDQSCSPPTRVKSEPSERGGGDPGEGEAGVSQGVAHAHPYLGVQSYPGLAALSGNLGVVGLSSSSSDLASIATPNPAGLVSVIMAAAPPRPQRRASNPLNCPVCGRVVLFRSEFEKHMRTHTGEKPFLCHLCSYRSAQRSNLNVHLKSVHKLYLPSSSAAASQPPPWNGNPDSRFIG